MWNLFSCRHAFFYKKTLTIYFAAVQNESSSIISKTTFLGPVISLSFSSEFPLMGPANALWPKL